MRAWATSCGSFSSPSARFVVTMSGRLIAVSAVYDVVNLFQRVVRLSLDAEVVNDKKRIAAQAIYNIVPVAPAPVQVVHNPAKVLMQTAVPCSISALRCTRQKTLAGAHLAPQQQADIFALKVPPLCDVVPGISHLRFRPLSFRKFQLSIETSEKPFTLSVRSCCSRRSCSRCCRRVARSFASQSHGIHTMASPVVLRM